MWEETFVYDLENQFVLDEIIKRKAKKVLLQFPEGLRGHALETVKWLSQRSGAEFYVSGDPCYGACDIPVSSAKSLAADLVVHYGHSAMLDETGIPVLYVRARTEIDFSVILDPMLLHLQGIKRVGLATTIQHLDQLEELKQILASHGVEAYLGEEGRRNTSPGQVLGCDYSSPVSIEKNVDAFVFLGGGRFHPIGLGLTTGKDVVTVDPYTGRAEKLGEKERILYARKRMAAISRAMKARSFGVIIGSKPGQSNPALALSLKDTIERRGASVLLLYMAEITYGNLTNFTELEAFINTACPRVAIDEIADLPQPLITFEEALVMVGEAEWETVWRRTFAPNRVKDA